MTPSVAGPSIRLSAVSGEHGASRLKEIVDHLSQPLFFVLRRLNHESNTNERNHETFLIPPFCVAVEIG
jgi:hypothetical protein